MPLNNQPYLPLYVDDWMNNSKLKLCSPGSHGLMISIMCLMHKEEEYGKILLKQKFKQTDKQISNFASQIAKQTSFDSLDVELYLDELITEKVLFFEDDYLICNRMVKMDKISKIRAGIGKQGGKQTQLKAKKIINNEKNFAKAKYEANTVIENVIINDNNKDNKFKEITGHEKQLGMEIVRATATEAWSDKAWVEQLAMGVRLSMGDIKLWMSQFNASICNDYVQDFNERVYKKMFVGWLSMKQSKGRKLIAPEVNDQKIGLKKLEI